MKARNAWHLEYIALSNRIWCHRFCQKIVSEDLLEQILTLAAILATKSTSSHQKVSTKWLRPVSIAEASETYYRQSSTH